MKENLKIEMLKKKLEKELKKIEKNFVEGFLNALAKYPIYTFCSTKDIENLLKDIWENKNSNPIIVELIYEEIKKKKKKDKEENFENSNEAIEQGEQGGVNE